MGFVILDDGSKWFDTKDLGYMDEDGFVFITGRISRVIVRQDFKISAEVIENKISRHRSVKECAVISRPIGADEEPIAFITTIDSCGASEIMKDIQNGSNPLADLEMPVQIIVLEEMPYLGSGKIDYVTLKKMI